VSEGHYQNQASDHPPTYLVVDILPQEQRLVKWGGVSSTLDYAAAVRRMKPVHCGALVVKTRWGWKGGAWLLSGAAREGSGLVGVQVRQ
jgi:hypothetical protein